MLNQNNVFLQYFINIGSGSFLEYWENRFRGQAYFGGFFTDVNRRRQDFFPGVGRHRQDFTGVVDETILRRHFTTFFMMSRYALYCAL